MIDKIEFLIPTFERPETCQATINSIRLYYPDALIRVADDSLHHDELTGCIHHHCEPDIGVSRKRNELVEISSRPYVFLLDDDNMWIIEETRLDIMYCILVNDPSLALVGCRKYDEGRTRWSNFEGDIFIENDILVTRKPKRRQKSERHPYAYYLCDQVPMFFLARREVFRHSWFDVRMKTCGEHMDFFMRLAAANGNAELSARAMLHPEVDVFFPNAGQLNVAFTPDSWFKDTGARPTVTYKQHRRRGGQFRNQFRRNWGLKNIKQWNSNVVARADYT
jgi:hypothetical protein